MLVPLNITGATYKHPSLPLSAQRTINFWPQFQDDKSTKSPYILHPWPGLKSFATTSGRPGGMFAHQGTLYKVTGTTLYSIDSSGTETSRGTISGTGPCVFDGIGSNVVVVRNGQVWIWNGSSLTEVIDADLETPNGVTHLNNQVIYDGDSGRFASSDVGDASSIDGLNYATAEAKADDLIIPKAFQQQVFLFGSETIEPWWNSGSGKPPFDRIEGGIIEIGLQAKHSIGQNMNNLYFLGTDSRIYQIQGPGSALAVTTKAIAAEISRMDETSDAIGWCFTMDDQYFYLITFPSGNRTFVYPEGGQWFELSSGTSGGKFNGTSYAFAYGKHLVEVDGKVLEWDVDTFDEDGDPIRRVRDMGPIHGGLFGVPGKELTMNAFELIMETGVGLVSGQGSDPKVMLSFSDDGGKTFSTETWGSIGKMAEFLLKVEWFALGRFTSRIIRIATSDPVSVSLHLASTDIEAGI